MTLYRVVHAFRDRDDSNYYYHAGATYPRDGLFVSPERLAYLSGSKNRMQTPLIEKVEDIPAENAESKPKKVRRGK